MQPDGEPLLVVAVRAIALQPLEERRRDHHRGHDADTRQPEAHRDRTHQARQHQADG